MSNRRSVREKDQSAGLPKSSKPASPLEKGFVVIGKFRRPHGVNGDMLFEVMTDFPERLTKGKYIYVGDDYQKKLITSARQHNVGLILHVEGYETPEDAGVFRNMMVYVKIEDLPELKDGGLYIHELIGMNVITTQGVLLGTLSEIMETGANDVFIIHDAGGNELLLPDIASVVLDIDLKKAQITVQSPEWL